MMYGDLQSMQQLFYFQSSHQCFISISRNTDSLNQLWNCYSSFIFKWNQFYKIINYFLVIYWSSVSSVVVVEKELLHLKHLGKFYSLHPWLFLITWKFCHQYLLSMIHPWFKKTCQSFLPWQDFFSIRRIVWKVNLQNSWSWREGSIFLKK